MSGPASSKIRHFPPPSDLERVIHALISARLDYCNSHYLGISQTTISHLQLVQNAAARLLTKSRKQDHTNPIVASSHWLPVHFRINFKILLIVYKSLHGLAPTYISELLTPYSTTRLLPSAHRGMLALPCAWKKNKTGAKAFFILAPWLWNSLLEAVRQAVDAFKMHLKTHFYAQAFSCI